MKSKLLFSLLLLFFFNSAAYAQDCPTFPDCYDIQTSITITPIDLLDEGAGCTYSVRFEGLDDFSPNCFDLAIKTAPTTVPAPSQSGADPYTFIVTVNNPSNAPVVHKIFAFITQEGSNCVYEPMIEDVPLRCCVDDDVTGIELNATLVDCVPGTGDPENCVYEISVDVNNIDPVSYNWASITSQCPNVPNAPNTGNSSSFLATFENCDFPYFVSVTVTDEYGCEYEETIEVMCTGCSDDPCADPPPAPDVKVAFDKTYCVQCPFTDIFFCRYDLYVLNPEPGLIYKWTYQSQSGLDGGSSQGFPAPININSTEPYLLTLIILDEDTNCVLGVYEYDLECVGDEDCEVFECGDPDLIDLSINVTPLEPECIYDFNEKGQIVGTLATCTFNVTTNAPPGSSSIMEIAYSENSPNTVTQPVDNDFDLTRTCGNGTLTSAACGATFCITVYDENACVIGGACDFVLCYPAGCFDEGNGGKGGERNGVVEASTALNATIYPNPVQRSVSNTLRFGNLDHFDFEAGTSIELFDLSGKILKSERATADWNRSMDLTDVNPGIYFLRIANGEAVLQVEKVVVLE